MNNKKKFLNEAFTVTKSTSKNGKPIAFIDPSKPENKETFKYKDIFKKHGANWDNNNRVWYWWLGDTKDKWQFALDRFIKPALEAVHKAEGAEENDSKSAIIASIDEILNKMDTEPLKGNQNSDMAEINVDEIKNRLASFKEKLVNIENEEEFKNTMSAIVRFKNAQGHKLSFGNAILVMIQDPKATQVMGRNRWKDPYGRNVKDGAKAIMVYVPNTNPYAKKDVNAAKEDFAKSQGYESFDQMPAGVQDKFNVRNRGSFTGRFTFGPVFDIRFTEPIEGVEDKAKDLEAKKDVKSYEEGAISEEVRPVYDGLLSFAKSAGINVETVSPEALDGARGVSMSGKIQIINNEGNDVGITKTLAHEITHELLHQKYLKENNTEYGKYFVGTQEGMGKVEQQAEIAAWAIMNAYGFDLDISSMNYVAMWGADNSNTMVKVFDTVTGVINLLIDKINANISSNNNQGELQENVDGVSPAHHISPDQLAAAIGMKDQLDKAQAEVGEHGEGLDNNDMNETEIKKKKLIETFYKKVKYKING